MSNNGRGGGIKSGVKVAAAVEMELAENRF